MIQLLKTIVLLTALLSSGVFASELDEAMVLAKQGGNVHHYNLGAMYIEAKVVPESYVKAYVWMMMAQINDHESAKHMVQQLKKVMTKDQIAKAQELASKCYESSYKDCD
jgi:TPR repeat protein